MTEKSFTPREIVSELDRYIVGQRDAKRAVAIALRNRWRRQQLPEELREEVQRVVEMLLRHEDIDGDQSREGGWTPLILAAVKGLPGGWGCWWLGVLFRFLG